MGNLVPLLSGMVSNLIIMAMARYKQMIAGEDYLRFS